MPIGMSSLSRAHHELDACLGSTKSACLNVMALETVFGLDQNDATIYVTVAAQQDYQCGSASSSTIPYELFCE